jgi:hypothetical protein
MTSAAMPCRKKNGSATTFMPKIERHRHHDGTTAEVFTRAKGWLSYWLANESVPAFSARPQPPAVPA